jgi:TRAP-type C4-dicarboxylate transport system permease small subunit
MLAALRLAEKVARLGAWLGGALVVAAALLTVAEIVTRKVIDQSFGGVSSLTGYLLACSSAWAFALTLIDRSHLRVDLVYAHMPRRAKGALDVLALAALTAFSLVLLTQAWTVFYTSYKFTSRDLTPLRIYLEYPQLVWLAGIAFLFTVSLLLLIIAIHAYASSDWYTLTRVAAPTSANEELEAAKAQTETGGP